MDLLLLIILLFSTVLATEVKSVQSQKQPNVLVNKFLERTIGTKNLLILDQLNEHHRVVLGENHLQSPNYIVKKQEELLRASLNDITEQNLSITQGLKAAPYALAHSISRHGNFRDLQDPLLRRNVLVLACVAALSHSVITISRTGTNE